MQGKKRYETVEDVLGWIAHSQDIRAVAEVEVAARDRRRLLQKREFDAEAAEAWDRVKGAKKGDTLYCHMRGVSLGGPWQRGDALIVDAVQPRKKLLWVSTARGEVWYFNPHGIARDDLRFEPPADAITPREREFADKAGQIVAEALSAESAR